MSNCLTQNLFGEKDMPKYFAFLFLFVSLAVSLGLSSNAEVSKNRSSFINPFATPTPITTAPILTLERKRIIIPCPPEYSLPTKICPDNTIINVQVNAGARKKREPILKYKVSGGKIIGKGKNVQWDLADARPGTYTITVNIADGKEITESTETIEIVKCMCGGDCLSCPIISISTSNETIEAGFTISFGAYVSGGNASDMTYNWTVSSGEILDGQGTPTINVKTNSAMIGSQLKATVEIGGDELCFGCQRTESATVEIIK